MLFLERSEMLFIDGSDEHREGVWVNRYNESLQFQNFLAGEPNGFTHENCVAFCSITFVMCDIGCWWDIDALCEKEIEF